MKTVTYVSMVLALLLSATFTIVAAAYTTVLLLRPPTPKALPLGFVMAFTAAAAAVILLIALSATKKCQITKSNKGSTPCSSSR